MPANHDWRSQRALRLASGTALCLAVSFGLALPIPFLAPLICLALLATLPRPLPLKAGIGLAVLAALTTGSGLFLLLGALWLAYRSLPPEVFLPRRLAKPTKNR